MHFRIAHWSDPHGSVQAASMTNNLIDMLPNVDAVVNTGDVVQDLYDNDISYAALSKSMLCVGNHDALLDYNNTVNTSEHPESVATGEQQYNKFIKPFKDSWGVVTKGNTPNWYKDYPEQRIRLISIGVHIRTSENELTESIAKEFLNGAKILGYSVIIITHEIDSTKNNAILNTFSTFSYYTRIHGYWPDADLPNDWPFVLVMQNIADEFVNTGGKIILWLNGHEHSDGFFIRKNYPIFALGSSKIDVWNDVTRTESNATTDVVMNLYDIDTERNIIVCNRLGSCSLIGGGYRKSITFDVEHGKVLTQIGKVV